MKWRCPQCGKPHERNDPPCDNCGHHKLEEAVVPTASAGDDYEQFAWACTECGRVHQRNSPPCKRCGNPHFEKQSMEFDDTEVGSVPTYRELIGRFEAAVIVAVVALVAVFGLGLLGVIQVPGILPLGTPAVSDVPGENTTYGNVSLADIEANVTADIDAQRTGPPLERDDGLDDVATYVTRRTVKNNYTDENRPVTERDIRRFETDCSSTPGALTRTVSGVSGDETAVTLAQSLGFGDDPDVIDPTDSEVTKAGVDAHVGPDGRLFVTVAYC